MKKIKKYLLCLSLSNPNNWELYKKTEWSNDIDGWIKPRVCYRHKKHKYFITNAFTIKPLHITDLINKFMNDYKNDNLLMNETLYIISN